MTLSNSKPDLYSDEDGERAVQVWPLLIDAATRQHKLTLGELAAVIFGTTKRSSDLDMALWMVRMYCCRSGLPPLELIAADFAAIEDWTGSLRAVFAFDWSAVRRPTAGNMVGALDRLTGNL